MSGSSLFSTTQVASSVPFDPTNNPALGFVIAGDVQSAIEELRKEVIKSPVVTATTASGTLTLSNTSNTAQILTGSATGYSVVLPDATTLVPGQQYELYNVSSEPLTVKTSGGATLFTLSQTSIGYLTLQTNVTAPGGWIAWQVFSNPAIASGIVNYQVVSSTNFASSSTTDVLITGFTVTPTAGTYAVWYNSSTQNTSGNAFVTHTIYLGGSAVTDSVRVASFNSANRPVVVSSNTVVACNGTQAVDVRVKTSAASQTVGVRSLLLIRLGA